LEPIRIADRHARQWTVITLALTTLSLSFAIGMQKIRCFDYWWHLRTGQLIAETGAVPFADPYSYSASGAPWIDIHWLFQLGLYATQFLTGHTGVVVAKAVMASLIVALLATIGWRRDRSAITALGLSLMLLVAGDRFMPRPELPSFVLLAGVLALLDRYERRPDNWIYALVPLQLLWANMHGLFAVGLAVIAIYVAAELLRAVLASGTSFWTPRLRRISTAAIAALAACAINPNGFDGLEYPLQQLGMIGSPEQRGALSLANRELSPLLSGSSDPWVLGLVAASAVLSFAAMLLNWRHVSRAHPLLWLSFGYLCLSANRNGALLAIVFAPIFVRNLNEFLDRHPPRPRLLQAVTVMIAVTIGALTVDVARGSFFARTGSTREPGLGISEAFYPMGAVDWIKRERPPGRIYHHMGDGGYLIWSLYPDYRVMVDGRLEVYGVELFQELKAEHPSDFERLDAQYQFGVVLLHYSLVEFKNAIRWFHRNPNWRLVYLDEAAALYVRLPKEGELRWEEIDVDAPDLFAQRHSKSDAIERFNISARITWFLSLGRFDRVLEEFQKIDPQERESPSAQALHAMLLQNTGKIDEAETVLLGLLNGDPANARILSQLGDIRMSMRDLAGASRFYDRALAANPHYGYAAQRRGVVAQMQGRTEEARGFFIRAQELSRAP
jgi:hypothetical protein